MHGARSTLAHYMCARARAIPRLKQYAVFHVFSNQYGANNVFKQIDNRAELDPTKNNVAILLGESFSASIAPVLLKKNIKTMIFIDKDPRVLEHTKYLLDCIKKCKNIEAFIRLLFNDEKNPILRQHIKFNNIFLF